MAIVEGIVNVMMVVGVTDEVVTTPHSHCTQQLFGMTKPNVSTSDRNPLLELLSQQLVKDMSNPEDSNFLRSRGDDCVYLGGVVNRQAD